MCDDEGDEEREEQVYNTDYQVWQDGGSQDSYKVWQNDGTEAPYLFFQTTFGYPCAGYQVFEDGTVHFKSVDGSAAKVVPDSYIVFADAEEHDGYPLPTVTLYTNCSGPGWARDCSPQEFGAELLKMDFGSPPPNPVSQRTAPLQQTAAWLRQWNNFTQGGCLCVCVYLCYVLHLWYVTHTYTHT